MYNTFPLFLHLRWFGTRRSRLDRQNDAVKSRLLQGTTATGSNAQSSHRSLFLSLFDHSIKSPEKHPKKLNSVFHSISDHEFKLNTTIAEQILFKLTQFSITGLICNLIYKILAQTVSNLPLLSMDGKKTNKWRFRRDNQNEGDTDQENSEEDTKNRGQNLGFVIGRQIGFWFHRKIQNTESLKQNNAKSHSFTPHRHTQTKKNNTVKYWRRNKIPSKTKIIIPREQKGKSLNLLSNFLSISNYVLKVLYVYIIKFIEKTLLSVKKREDCQYVNKIWSIIV